ncbi:MAG: hypothetical protein KC422_22350 [Trueperaceae bacterium]|nr:hypothetical protein [Trueperaceae bacterium]
MFVVRDIFQLEFGKARDAIDLLKEIKPHMDTMGFPAFRVLTDYAGPAYYTIILEAEYETLSTYEASLAREIQDPTWRAWYEKFTAVAESGKREILRLAL